MVMLQHCQIEYDNVYNTASTESETYIIILSVGDECYSQTKSFRQPPHSSFNRMCVAQAYI